MPDELDQLTKMQIERVRVRLQCPMLGTKKRIWSSGWSSDHTTRPVMSQNAFFKFIY